MTKIKKDLVELMNRYKELEFIINKSPVIVFLWKNEENWPVEFVSENITQFGYTRDEFLSGKIKYSDIIHPKDLERVKIEVAKYSQSDMTEFKQEYRIISKSKETIWIDDRTFIRRSNSGEITHFQGVILDISDIKKVQQDLEESEKKFRGISEQILIGIGILQDGKILYVNKMAEEIFGYNMNEMQTWDEGEFVRTIHPDDLERELEYIKTIQTDPNVNEIQFQTRGIKKSGDIFYADAIFKKLTYNDRPALIGMFIDISEQFESERKLKESEEKFRQISEQLLVSVGILQDNKVIYVNKKLCETFGYDYEELTSWTFDDFHKVIHPDSIEEEIKLIEQIIQDNDQQEIQFQSKAIKKSGEIIWAENLFRKITYNGRPALLGMFIDITEKKEAESALKLTQFAIDHSVDPAFWMDEKFQIIYVNEALCKSLGYTREELLSMKGFDLNPTYPKEAWRPTWERIKEKGSIIIETYHQKKNGVLIPVEAYISYLQYDNKEYNCAFAHDISDRKKSERKLKESEEKYREAFYRENFYKDLFTHDMRNILQPIRTSLELYEYESKNKMELLHDRDFFEKIHFQIDRATHLINNIKKFSEIESFEQSLEEMNIYQLLQMNISNIQKSFKNKKTLIKLEPNYQSNYLILGNELLNEVIENILLNSIIHNDNDEIHISIGILKVIKNQKAYIRIDFSDNGRGIEDSRKKIIFNRAYNQDKSTIGMGLGLSLVRIIVGKLDGLVWVEDRIPNDYKQGSKFIVLLPEVDC